MAFNLRHLLHNEHDAHSAFFGVAADGLEAIGHIEKSSLIFGVPRQPVAGSTATAHNTTTPLGAILRELPANKARTEVDYQQPDVNRDATVTYLRSLQRGSGSYFEGLWMVIGLLYTSLPLRESVRRGTETGVYTAFFAGFDDHMIELIHGRFSNPKIPNDPKSIELVSGCLSPIEICLDILRRFDAVITCPATANPHSR